MPKIHYALYEDCREQRGSTGQSDVLALLAKHRNVTVMGIGGGAMFGPQAAYFAELFGPRLRYSGFAFARELGSIIAGGPSPFIAALLVGWMAGAPWGVACYVILLSLITAFAIWCGPETRFNDIRADTPEDLVADGPVAKHV